MSGTDYTLTPNYGLYKPTPSADNDLWGGHLNTNADTLDSVLHTLSTTGSGVASFNTRTGAVTLTSGDVTTALAYTPYNATNPSGYQTAAQVTAALAAGDPGVFSTLSASGTVSGAGFTALLAPYAPLASPVFTGAPSMPIGATGFTQTAGNNTTALATTAFVGAAISGFAPGVTTFNTRSGAVTLTASDVTTALSFTPYNATNPAGYQTATQVVSALVAGQPGAFSTLSASGTVSGSGFVSLLAPYAPLASPTFTGTPAAPTATVGTTTTQIATTAFVAAAVSAGTAGVASFNTRTGAVTLTSTDVTTALTFTPYNATNPSNYQTSAQVVSAIAGANPGVFSTLSASGTVSGAGFTTLLAPYAPIASPTFTGVPAAPTAAGGTSTTQLATTAFVGSAITTAAVPAPNTVTTPVMDGTAAIGTLTTYARPDHIHPTDTSRAPLASPTFTGTPAAPTAATATSTTQLATTAFVHAVASGGVSFASGATGARPALPSAGTFIIYGDTTLGIPVFGFSTGWVNAAGVAV